MESKRFDQLTRLVSSRRTFGLVFGGATLLGLADGATAKRRKKKNCKHFKIRVVCDGTTCLSHKVGTCGKKFVRCTCGDGVTCLSNKGCGQACPPECPAGCTCASGDVQVCVKTGLGCNTTPIPCSTIADCPARTVCSETACGAGGATEKRCVLLCAV